MAQQTGVQNFEERSTEGGTWEWSETKRNGKERWRRVVIKIVILKRLSECFRVCCLLRQPDENEVDNPNEFLITTGKTDENGEWSQQQEKEQQQNEATAKSENVMLGLDLYRCSWDARWERAKVKHLGLYKGEEGSKERETERKQGKRDCERGKREKGRKTFLQM